MRFFIKEIDEKYLPQIMQIQESVFEEGYSEKLLRRNSFADFLEVFRHHHYVLGAFSGRALVAFAILQVHPENNEVLLSAGKNQLASKSSVVKTVIVKKEFRGYGLQKRFLLEFEKYDKKIGNLFELCSVAPENSHSLTNFLQSGFAVEKKAKLYQKRSERLILCKSL